jgi:energy-coupling factor transport system ATP-binding protein
VKADASPTIAVAVDRLSYTFAGRETPTLRNISFSLAPGTWTLVTGRTGSGKSTLLRALAGWIPRHSAGVMEGDIWLFGENTRDASPAALAGRVGLMLQSADDQICTTTCADEIAFGLENLALPVTEIGARVAEQLNRFGLASLNAQPTHQLSGGQKQRLLLAAILAMRPGLLLLDEPFSQLDPQSAAELLTELDRLRRAGLTIVCVEHRLDELLSHVDRLIVMDGGQLVGDVGASDAKAVCGALDSVGLELPELAQLARAIDHPAVFQADRFIDAAPHCPPAMKSESVPSLSSRAILHAQDLAFRFPTSAQPVIQNATFIINAGDRIAVVGPNGAGKSTLLALLAGVLKPSSGKMDFEPVNSNVTPAGLVLQNPDLMLFCTTVWEELAFGPQQQRLPAHEVDARVLDAATLLALDDLLDEPPQGLSQGQRLRTAIAATLTLRPQLLLLDEPTTGQDQQQVNRVLAALDDAVERLKNVGALVFSTHDMRAVARFANRVLVLGEGRLLADLSPHELLVDDRLLAQASLRRPPLFEVRHRLTLRGMTVDKLAKELRA